MDVSKLATLGSTIAIWPLPNPAMASASRELARQYSDDEIALDAILERLTISVTCIGVETRDGVKERNLRYNVSVTYNNKTITFEFGTSIADTSILLDRRVLTFYGKEKYKELSSSGYGAAVRKIMVDWLYSVLCCMRSDSYIPEEFEDFCSEFGYDTDSRKAETTHRACIAQSRKIHSLFTDSELASFPS
jgi:hypothetical protein